MGALLLGPQSPVKDTPRVVMQAGEDSHRGSDWGVCKQNFLPCRGGRNYKATQAQSLLISSYPGRSGDASIIQLFV